MEVRSTTISTKHKKYEGRLRLSREVVVDILGFFLIGKYQGYNANVPDDLRLSSYYISDSGEVELVFHSSMFSEHGSNLELNISRSQGENFLVEILPK